MFKKILVIIGLVILVIIGCNTNKNVVTTGVKEITSETTAIDTLLIHYCLPPMSEWAIGFISSDRRTIVYSLRYRMVNYVIERENRTTEVVYTLKTRGENPTFNQCLVDLVDKNKIAAIYY